MAELFEAVTSWQTLLLVLLVFGLAPGLVLRGIVRLYPKDHPRRRELVAELYVIPRWERPLFVAEQLEVGLTEGLPERVRARRARRRGRPRLWPAKDSYLTITLILTSLITGLAGGFLQISIAWSIGIEAVLMTAWWMADSASLRRRGRHRASSRRR